MDSWKYRAGMKMKVKINKSHLSWCELDSIEDKNLGEVCNYRGIRPKAEHCNLFIYKSSKHIYSGPTMWQKIVI